MPSEIAISNLCNITWMLEPAANRIWHAWSMSRGLQLKEVIAKLEGIVGSDKEFTLIAHTGDTFIGTVSLIESDLPERSNLSPWIAAVWVDIEFRKHGVGSALIGAAERLATSFGYGVLHLYCAPELRSFYSNLGWVEIEAEVGKGGSSVFEKKIGGPP